MGDAILFDTELNGAGYNAAKTMINAVGKTMGPAGATVIYDSSHQGPKVTKDGKTVASNISFADNAENAVANLIKSAAQSTDDAAGDGTTTATMLTGRMYLEGQKAATAGMAQHEIVAGINAAVDYTVQFLKDISVPCTSREDIENVSSISANNDKSIGKIIADATDKVGKEAVIEVQDGRGLEDELEVVEGMNFDRGYLSPYFVTNQKKMSCELDKPFILLADKKVSSIRDMLPTLESIAKSGRPLLVIAEDIDGEALTTLVVNNLRGTVKLCAVKAPGFGDRRKEIFTRYCYFNRR